VDRVVLTVRPRTILAMAAVAGAVVLAAIALRATRNVVAELALAGAIACLVRPGVLWLAKRTRMGFALAAVFIGLIVSIAALVGGEARAISTGGAQLQHAIPDRIQRFQDSLAPGNAVRRFLEEDDVAARIRRDIQGAPARFILGTESPTKGASRAGEILLVASLAAFMVTELPTIVRAVGARLPPAAQARAQSAVAAGYHTGGAYVRRTLALAGACAVAAGLVAWGCGVPGPAVVGLWLGMWALVPKMGIVVGGLPLLVLAAGQGPAAIVFAAIALAALVAAGEWGRVRWVERPTVRVGAFASLVALMTGMEFGRWPGAFVALVAVSVVLAGAAARGTSVAQLVRTPSPVAGPPAGPPTAPVTGQPLAVTVEINPWSLVLTAAVAVSLVAGVTVIRSVPHALARIGIGVLGALALNPVVDVVRRRLHLNRKAAVAAVVCGSLAAVAAFALLAVPRAVDQTRQLSHEVPKLVAQVDRAPLVGRALRASHADARVRSFLDDLPQVLTTHDKSIQGAAKVAGESVLAVSWVLLVLVAALMDGPMITEHAKRAVAPQRRPKVERLGDLAYQAVGRSAAGSALAALLQGAVVLVIALLFGVPLAPLLAANGAFWAFVPQIGGFMAAAPLVVFALAQGFGTAVAVFALFMAWMLFDNHVLHAVIIGRAARISALASLVAVLVGGALGGFPGAMVAVPIASVARALVPPLPEAEPEPGAGAAPSPMASDGP
jgi:predicted PurR-regulated permease PerM